MTAKKTAAQIDKKQVSSAKKEKNALYVVGIGASAGGLEALQALVNHLKPTGHLSYIIAQHMAPDQKV